MDVIKDVFGGNPGMMCETVNATVFDILDPFRRFILMPSCDLPPDTPLKNVKAFLACADQWSA